jgi:hypothetical protein
LDPDALERTASSMRVVRLEVESTLEHLVNELRALASLAEECRPSVPAEHLSLIKLHVTTDYRKRLNALHPRKFSLRVSIRQRRHLIPQPIRAQENRIPPPLTANRSHSRNQNPH